MDRRANVVDKAGQSEFGGACATANLRFCLNDKDGTARLRHDNRCREPVRPRSNHNRVVARKIIQWVGFWLY